MTKLCKDCKYYQRNWWGHNVLRTDSYDTCLRPSEMNYITGKTNKETCKNERGYSFNCSKEGKYWVAKSEEK